MLMGMQRTSWILYGPSDAKIMLSVLSLVIFRDLDPAGGFQQAQKYYTNQNPILIALK
jgi:hypothetical protein